MKIEDLKTDLKFTSKWFPGEVIIEEVSHVSNILKVRIVRHNGYNWYEDWNLQHTIWGFENGDYKLIK